MASSSTSFIQKPANTKHLLSSSDVGFPSFLGNEKMKMKMKKKKNTFLPASSTTTTNRRYSFINASAGVKAHAKTVVTSKIKKASSSLARVWREIQGMNNWEGLMEPLNSILQDEIIRYGEFVNACYKVFDLDSNSKRYLNCKYGKKNMLKEIGMESCGYEVTKYIYATPDINIPTQNGTCCSRWIGYVAVSSDEEAKKLGRRDILITFRGTVTNTEWIANFMSALSPARLDPCDLLPNVKVESGFLTLYTSDDSSCKFGVGSCREQLLSEVSRIINKFKYEEMSISLAGHSMGSSLAVLHAYDIAELELNRNGRFQEIPITVFSFGGPRVGNTAFKERCEELGVKVLRVVNINDPVTKLPGVFFNENYRALGGNKYDLPWSRSCYAHVGVELALDFFKMQDPSCVHDLETYIRLLRCPKRLIQTQKDIAAGTHDEQVFLNKAKEFVILLIAQKFDTSPWQNAVRNVGDLVQTLLEEPLISPKYIVLITGIYTGIVCNYFN